MVEGTGNKDGEKVDIDLAGQEGVQLTLDQVLTLAFQYVRNNREIYGRYASSEMVWALERADETENFYDIRLSYRPARGFRGRPGVERFIISKTGADEVRQIISEPRSLWQSLRIPAAVGALLVAGVALGVLFNAGVLGSQPSSSFTIEQIGVELKPDVPGRLESPNGSVVVDVPAASVTASSQLNYQQLSLTEIPVLPASFRPTKVFDLTTDAPLLKPITITVELSAGDVLLAEDVEANILIQHHRDGAWVPLDTRIDFGASTATGQVDHLSIFALAVKEPAAISPATAYLIGQAYYEDGQYHLAIDEFTLAIELEPGVRGYYWFRGLSYVDLANFPKAIEDYTSAIALDPANATLHALRGSAYSKYGQSEQAFVDLDKAISLNPNHAMAYYHRGDVFTELGQDQKAKSDYDTACQIEAAFCR